jgi:hypothetical protein
MKIAYRIYVLLCVGLGIFLQAGTPRPDYFMGAFYGLVGSWIGPGMIARAICEAAGWGKTGVPAMLGISLAFWLLFFTLARRPRRRQALIAAPPAAPDVLWTYSRRTSTRTYYEEE